MTINIANILKALSRLRKATFALTVLFIFLILLSAPTIYAATADSAISMRIGPLLRKTIEESKKALIDQQTDKRVPLADQPTEQLYKVIVVINGDHLKPLPSDVIEELRKRVELLGGHIGNHAYNNVQVWIPLDRIENLLEWSEILRVDEPLIPQAHSIISEGTGLIGATNANNRGLKGKGVKVGIIDLGFKGYTSLGTELPPSVKTKVMGTDADFVKDAHGAACAEIVHDVAPEAELFLVNIADIDVDFHNAVSWLLSQGVHVISSSIGINLKFYVSRLYWALQGSLELEYASIQMQYLDRVKSQWDHTINSAVSGGGVTWAQSSGNDGQKQWLESFNDSDGDFWLNFSSSQNYNAIDVTNAKAGDELYVLMMWGLDNGFSTTDDFDLIVTDENVTEVCSSRIRQSTLRVGIEACKFTVDKSKHYFLWVLQWLAKPQQITILLGHDTLPNFTHYTSAKTVSFFPPAHNPNIITVGAVSYKTPSINEPYSSQGPTADGVIKPDLVAPDCVSAVSWGGFFCGTSAAAPHVAGLSALVKQAYPTWAPSQIKSYLESKATDLGTIGKDNVFGSGLAQLPSDLMVTECDLTISPKGYGYNSLSNTGTITVTAPFTSCTWTATSNDSWVTVTSGATGTGSGTITYSVAANTGIARTGTLIIDGQTFTVTQTDSVTFTQAQLDQAVTNAVTAANAAKDKIISQKDETIASLNKSITQKDLTISSLNTTITSMYTKTQLDQTVADASAAKDSIITQKDQTIASMFTKQQLDKAVADERKKWDMNNDGKVGLEEVINLLQILGGLR